MKSEDVSIIGVRGLQRAKYKGMKQFDAKQVNLAFGWKENVCQRNETKGN